MNKVCCIISQQIIPEYAMTEVKNKLNREIRLAVIDGFTTYISGFGTEIDLLFAQIVIELREDHPRLYLEAALPYRNYITSNNKRFRHLLLQCNGIGVYSEEHTSDCFAERDRIIVRQSHRIIGIYDGWGMNHAFAALQYADELKKEICLIKI